MKYDVSSQDAKRAAHPHELILVNLILNHVFFFVSTLGLSGPYPLLPLMVPTISVSILAFIFWRANREHTRDSWFVSAHWQICARRSRIFLAMLAGACLLLLLGWMGYIYLHMAKVLVLALFAVAGLPVMVTMLVLVVLESEALHQARNGSLPQWAAQRFAASKEPVSN
ncbi:MAG: hypothetical protein WAW75_02960 [Gallionella sp.]